ncbi:MULTISPECIES: class I SAM-dependent methyltransferase [Pediococcus]|jgi:16S rRNA (guanine1207-N2)-methyltransferase|uniref:class I SAM-dependent methyltransferase n=1 Tax=Pediococcus TaxID=1253 RepID=UPI00070ADCF2|nr:MULTISPECIES: class I SAM-dependent methyltransferase [Pediococcus]MCT3027238.1 methyltransferase domain-containing protein [Pediococcus parvulus]MCT3029344.1 methyltransferase domain-containing protein [Pediococcus parvulus]MCT3031878.1 methyltransferase domain-containing protein [Pediococcus parvulus]MCT3035577.1 methyltransferase domain-containing protein [Pediococcus parvulus]MDN5575334.1 class I SAM-dependent methyltransferase [Pediococcus sp.]
MTEYYYTQNPEVLHEKRQWQFTLLNQNLTFNSDNGVFSKATVDFGTRTLLEALNLKEFTGEVLDVGCGYGPIGLAIAKAVPEIHVDLVDVNLRALDLCKENAEQNNIHNVTIWESDTYDKVEKTTYQTVVSNPPVRAGKSVVTKILVEAKNHLQVGGSLIIVLQKKQGAPSAKKKMEQVFGNAEIIHKQKGYYIIKSVKESQ